LLQKMVSFSGWKNTFLPKIKKEKSFREKKVFFVVDKSHRSFCQRQLL
jgi:hypothetical protein